MSERGEKYRDLLLQVAGQEDLVRLNFDDLFIERIYIFLLCNSFIDSIKRQSKIPYSALRGGTRARQAARNTPGVFMEPLVCLLCFCVFAFFFCRRGLGYEPAELHAAGAVVGGQQVLL